MCYIWLQDCKGGGGGVVKSANFDKKKNVKTKK